MFAYDSSAHASASLQRRIRRIIRGKFTAPCMIPFKQRRLGAQYMHEVPLVYVCTECYDAIRCTKVFMFLVSRAPQVFTSASTIVFKTFACDSEAVEGESFLRADYGISCKSRTHAFARVYATLMILVSDLFSMYCFNRSGCCIPSTCPTRSTVSAQADVVATLCVPADLRIATRK